MRMEREDSRLQKPDELSLPTLAQCLMNIGAFFFFNFPVLLMRKETYCLKLIGSSVGND